MTDLEALHQYAASKDPESFRHLVLQYQRLVYSAAARRLGQSHDIEDAVQLTFLKLAKAAGTIQRDLASWLYSTSLNTANDLIRRDRSRQRTESLVPPRVETADTTDIDREELRRLSALIDDALLQLPGDQRSLLVEHFFQNHSQRELAEQFGMSQATVQRRIASAIDGVRQYLAARGFTSDAALLSTAIPLLTCDVSASLTGGLAKIGIAGVTAKAQVATASFWTASKLLIAGAIAASIATVATVQIVNQPVTPPPAVAATVTAPAATLPGLEGVAYTRIRVHFDNLTAAEAVAEFSRQTGFTVEMFEASAVSARGTTLAVPVEPLSMHLEDVPLLEGFSQLARGVRGNVASLTPSKLMISNGSLLKTAEWSVHGPFAIRLNEPTNGTLRNDANITYRNNKLGHFSLTFYVQPGFDLGLFPTTATLDNVTDDRGQPIELDSLRSPNPDFNYQGVSMTLQVNVIFPDQPGTAIPALKGFAPFQLITRKQSLRTAIPSERLTQEIADASFEIFPLTLDIPQPRPDLPVPPKLFKGEIRIHRHNVPRDEWPSRLEQFAQSRITVFNAANQPMTTGGHIIRRLNTLATDAPLILTFQTSGSRAEGDADHVQIVIPVESKPVSVPFEFKNIPILPWPKP